MVDALTENDVSIWLSTYGLITAERILERYKIRLQNEDLIAAIKNPNNFYYHLLRVPLKNVFNGIILQQANDYQVYAQKLFIDYLMSGESGKSEGEPGGITREDLEHERKTLVNMGEDFHTCELAHNKLIADCQKLLFKHSDEWKKKLKESVKTIRMELGSLGEKKDENLITRIINILIVQWDLSGEKNISLKSDQWNKVEKIIGESLSNDVKQVFITQMATLGKLTADTESLLAEFINQTNEMSANLRQWRTDFHKLILRVNDLIQLLPEYHYDPKQNQENRDALQFDSNLGEK